MPHPSDHAARSHLRQNDPRLGAWMDRIGDLPLPRAENFSLVHALARSIAFQQLNGKAAETIFGRLQATLGGGKITAKGLWEADEAALRAEAPRLEQTLAFLKSAARLVPVPDSVLVYDPVPHVVTKRAGYERAQLLLQSGSRPALQEYLRTWAAALAAAAPREVRWHLDVDPIEFD